MFNATSIFSRWLILFIAIFLFSLSSALLADDDDIEVEGAIQSIGEDSLVVNGFIFDVDFHTEYKDDEGEIIFSDLAVGDFVEVEGRLISENRYYAEKIEREGKDDDDDERELETKGLIAALTDNSIKVNGYLFTVTAHTRIEGAHGLEVTFDQLKVGMFVEVEGHFIGTDSLVADEIELEEPDFDNELEFSGHIDSVLVDEIVINNRHIRVTNATLIELRNDQPGSFSDLTVGLFVEVKAAIAEDGLLTALRIKVEDDDENEIEITGRIDSVGVNFIELLDYRVEINPRTLIMNFAKDTVTITDLEKGQRVEVKGTLVADKVIAAERIKVKRFHQNEVEFSGQVTSVTENTIGVENTLFQVDDATVILDNNNNPIELQQVSTGLFVEVKGRFNADGSLYAQRIKIEDRDNDEVEFTGLIEALHADSITVSGIHFLVNDMTVVLDLRGNTMAYSDLKVDDVVEIKGRVQADGKLLAVRIKLEDKPGLIMVSGDITALTDDLIEIEGPQFRTDANSLILDQNYQSTTSASLKTGDRVTVWALQSQLENTVLQAKLEKSSGVTSVNDETIVLPEGLRLHANYPNPFNPETIIEFSINSGLSGKIILEVYDITGRKVRTLFNGTLGSGDYSFKWDGRNEAGAVVSSGMYIYMLRSADISLARKMTLIR